MILAAIAILTLLSYGTGIKAVLDGEYKPSLYSRAIWLLLVINALIGLIRLDAAGGVIALSAVQVFGSLLIFLAALKYTVLKFGLVERISTLLLIASGGSVANRRYSGYKRRYNADRAFYRRAPNLRCRNKKSKKRENNVLGILRCRQPISFARSR